MAASRKAKAAGISASSFFDLKAELVKREDEYARNKAAGKSTVLIGGVKGSDKKVSTWARQNKGVSGRAARDIELEAISKPTLESARIALERKAKIYDKLSKGKTGGLSDKQYNMLLVDFDAKADDEAFESDSDDVDESLQVPVPPNTDEADPIVEYEDEFGRIRTGRRSEIPRDLVRPVHRTQEEEDDSDIIYNPVHHFPVYEPSAERVAEIVEAHSEANNPLGVHYDATQEVRAKGAAFYQFSGDEETRAQQLEELKAAREETERKRQEAGAVTSKPGEVEGMRDETTGSLQDSAAGASRSRAMEKRKRELEERRKILDAKRRKVKSEQATALTNERDSLEALEATGVESEGKAKDLIDADTFLAQLEREIAVDQ